MAQTLTLISSELTLLSEKLIAKQWQLTIAESCTGGMLGEQITSMAGSSVWFDCGFITYSNASKSKLLDVEPQTIDAEGAVSEMTASEMALGALNNSQSHLSVAITGIAGPSGGTAAKPVGTVCFGWASEFGTTFSATHQFSGDRHAIRQQAVLTAIQGLNQLLNQLAD